MRTEPLPPIDQIPFAEAVEHHTDIQLLVHASWLLAGMAIALAGCTVADEADVHGSVPDKAAAIAHAQPQPNAASGNVQDLTY
jgi:hypothetical protein